MFKLPDKRIVFDLEAENLNLQSCRPWQAALMSNRKTYMSHIAIPNLKVSEGAARVTRFNQKYHDSVAKPLEEVCDFLWPVFNNEDYLLIGHNILGYDLYPLRNLFRLVGKELDIQSLAYRMRDTLAYARAYYWEVDAPNPEDKDAFLAWQYKMLATFKRGMKTSLGALCKEFEVPYDDKKSHDALYDVKVNAPIYGKLCYTLDIPQ